MFVKRNRRMYLWCALCVICLISCAIYPFKSTSNPDDKTDYQSLIALVMGRFQDTATCNPIINQSSVMKHNLTDIRVQKTDIILTKPAAAAVEDSNRKVILLWRSNPNSSFWDEYPDGSNFFGSRCPQRYCEITRDRSRAAEASVVVFWHVEKRTVWPEVRHQNQSYVHFLNERPGPWHESMINYNGRINITWGYRRDSDVSSHDIIETNRKYIPEEEYKPRIPLSNKTRSVVWPVSHCNASSKRDIYAKELSKYIDVDVYGTCGSLNCSRELGFTQCLENFESTYKFYLSFENRICRDYVTEKFFTPLQYELIPIVMGGGDYNEAGPPHSCINVRDYDSPKDLAKYLHFLADNEEAYYSYFSWKARFVTKQRNLEGKCLLCDIAHNIRAWSRPAREDYYNWWFSGCDDSLVDNMRAQGNW